MLLKEDKSETMGVETTVAPFPWDFLPTDLKGYVLQRTSIPTLFSMRRASRGAKAAVVHCLRFVSASNLLRMLPFFADDSGDLEQRLQKFSDDPRYRAARFEVLQFQRLARLIGLKSKWDEFKTLEQGILALMTVPLDELDAERVKALAFGVDQTLPSDFVLAELSRLQKLFGKERVDNFVINIRNSFQKNLKLMVRDKNNEYLVTLPLNNVKVKIQNTSNDYCIVLALMILRMSENQDIQYYCLDVMCTPAVDICIPLLTLLEYAGSNGNKRVLEVLEWLTESKDGDVKKRLEELKDHKEDQEKLFAINKLQRRWFRLLTAPGSLDRPTRLSELSPAIFYAITRPQHFSNYALWSCALIFGWERAWDLYKTIRAHAQIVVELKEEKSFERMRLFESESLPDFIPRNSFLNSGILVADGFASGPCFINLRDISFDTVEILRALVSLTYTIVDPADPSSRKSVCRYADVSINDEVCPIGQINWNCLMDNVSQNNKKLLDRSFQAVIFSNMQCNKTTIHGCNFTNVRFDTSTFHNTTFCYSKFEHCHFSSSVRFENCAFQKSGGFYITVFYQCKFDTDVLKGMSNIGNARFVDCEFPHDCELPKGTICYNTPTKDINTIESLYQFFKLLKQSNDADMIIQHLQCSSGRVWEVLRSYQQSGITREQDKLFREIVSYKDRVFAPALNFIRQHTGIVLSETQANDYEAVCNQMGIIVRDPEEVISFPNPKYQG